MKGTIKLNLHCHSNLSDGVLSPEALAGLLADAGASVAALTDHDRIDGTTRFRDALSLRGVAFVDAVELTTFGAFGEIHLLAYGVDADAPELTTALSVMNDSADQELQNFMVYLRRRGKRPHAGRLSTEAAIALIHRCGGIAVLAHPLNIPFLQGDLEGLLDILVPAGLDGLEAFYAPYSQEDRIRLAALAERRGLCMSMGTDFHAPDDLGHPPVLEVDETVWRDFRDRLLRQAPAFPLENTDPPDAAPQVPPKPASIPPEDAVSAKVRKPGRFSRFKLGAYSIRIVGASMVALGFFVAALFAVSNPYFEKVLMERKKEMIRELTAEAVSLIAEYASDETKGRSSREQAQADAIAHIRDLRYGRQGKDYFWITDMTPRMILHPYRTELEGQDVSAFKDDRGLRVFYEFTRAVRDDNEGYVEYLWQWKDDSHRIVPKLSYIKRFEPWGWVIGTGIYLDDVESEIDELTGRLVWLSALIAVILLLLLVYIARLSFRMEREKQVSDFAVRESKERYRALVEASSEGMVIVIDGMCTFANLPFLNLSGYTGADLVLLGLSELLLPYPGEEAGMVAFLASLPKNKEMAPEDKLEGKPDRENDSHNLACLFRCRSGELADVVVQASPFSLAGKKGSVLTVKDARILGDAASGTTDSLSWNRDLANSVGLGFFRARMNRRALILSADQPSRSLLGLSGDRNGLAGLFADPEDWDSLYDDLIEARPVIRRACTILIDGVRREVWLSLRIEPPEELADPVLSGLAEPVDQRAESVRYLRESSMELEAGLRVLDDPIPVGPAEDVHRIFQGASVRSAAQSMTEKGYDALVVQSPQGEDIGILTQGDLQARVLAQGLPPDASVASVMSAPLASAPVGTSYGQALQLLRERNIGHLAIRDGQEPVLALVGRKDLFLKESDGFALLAGAAARARDLGELGRIHQRMAERAKQLAAGGMTPRGIAAQVTHIGDRIAARLEELAWEALGPPPGPYVFLSLGSRGRGEALPNSDQDNAIIYGTPDDRDAPKGTAGASRKTQDYFRKLGAFLCDSLHRVGVPYCPGGVMAKNEGWCASADEWRKNFAAWISAPDSQEMLALNLCFDFSAGHGEIALAENLRLSLMEILRDQPAFFIHLAREALRRRTSFPQGNALFQGAAGDTDVDLKELSAQFVMYGRLYALKQGLAETNTYRRFEALAAQGVFGSQLSKHALEAYDAVTRLRMQRFSEGSTFPLRSFSPLETAALREAYSQSALIQKKIAFDFPGASG